LLFFSSLFCELQIVFNGSKPNVQEIGPITYAYNKHYQNISWAPEDDGDLLTYYRYNWYERADDGISAAVEALNVTTLNLPLLGLINSPVVNENPINIDVVAGLMAAVGYDGEITGPLCTQPAPCWPGQSQIPPFARHCSPPPSLPPCRPARAVCDQDRVRGRLGLDGPGDGDLWRAAVPGLCAKHD